MRIAAIATLAGLAALAAAALVAPGAPDCAAWADPVQELRAGPVPAACVGRAP